LQYKVGDWGFKIASKNLSKNEFRLNSKIEVPSEIFHDRSLSVLESISRYLKDKLKLSYHEIAELTNRDDRTIWTCYNRAKKKKK